MYCMLRDMFTALYHKKYQNKNIYHTINKCDINVCKAMKDAEDYYFPHISVVLSRFPYKSRFSL